MDIKGDCEEITYPKIYFAIDDFERVFGDIVVSEGECVCVELVARDRFRDKESVIFLGSIRFDVLQKLYDSRVSRIHTTLEYFSGYLRVRRLGTGPKNWLHPVIADTNLSRCEDHTEKDLRRWQSPR